MEMEARYNLKTVLQNIANALREKHDLDNNVLINPQDFSEKVFGISQPYLSENMVDNTGNGVDVISDVKFSDTITALGIGAFKTLTNIKSIYIDAGVTTIGASCFEGCTNLQTVEFNNSPITTLPERLFYQCASLAEITLPKGLKSISDSVFFNCLKLSSVEIPESVTKIGNFAFDGSGIEEIKISKNITSLGINPFTFCTKAKSIVVSGENPKYDSRDNCNAIIESEIDTLICKLPISTIPESVTAFGSYAYYKTRESEIVVPQQITSIGSYCFAQSSYIISVDMSNSSVEVIPTALFHISPELKHIKFSPRVKTIASNIFYYNEKLELLDFRNYDGEVPPTLGGSLGGAGTKFKIVIPNGDDLKDAWKSATNWSIYAERTLTVDEYNNLTNV